MHSWHLAILLSTAEIRRPFDNVVQSEVSSVGQCTLDLGSTNAATPTEYNGTIDTGSLLCYEESTPCPVVNVKD